MIDMLAMVREFHEKHGQPARMTPEVTPRNEQEFRAKLMREELKEYEDAAEAGDLVGMYDALLDLLYVTVGSLVSHGFPLAPGFMEVHTSNMTKDAIKVMGAAKVSKGPSYVAPDLVGAALGGLLPTTRCTCKVGAPALNDHACPVLTREGFDHNPGAYVLTLRDGNRLLVEKGTDREWRTLPRPPRGA